MFNSETSKLQYHTFFHSFQENVHSSWINLKDYFHTVQEVHTLIQVEQNVCGATMHETEILGVFSWAESLQADG